MLTDKSYLVTFVRKETFQEEVYHYNKLYLAMEHFRAFYNQESSDMYALISISEYCWSTGEKITLGLLSFYEFYHGSKIKKDWRNWSVGRKTIFEVHDFDGNSIVSGEITVIDSDHAIMETDGMRLWIDDDTLYMFR